MMTNRLTEKDIAKLLADPSGERRAETAAKIASDFRAGSLTEAERSLAEEIFRLMVKDAEVRVREALAQNIKESPNVPHDVAVSLARDVDSVAGVHMVLQKVDLLPELCEVLHQASNVLPGALNLFKFFELTPILLTAGLEVFHRTTPPRNGVHDCPDLAGG